MCVTSQESVRQAGLLQLLFFVTSEKRRNNKVFGKLALNSQKKVLQTDTVDSNFFSPVH